MKPFIQFVEIENLIELENNPRTISDSKLEQLCDSIERDSKFFWVRPCLVNQIDGKNIVYAGNQRLKAAKKLGWKEVPCILESLTIEEQNKRMLKDNINSGEFDINMLLEEFDFEFLKYDVGLDIIPNFKDDEMLISTSFETTKSIKSIQFNNWKIPLTDTEAEWLSESITNHKGESGSTFKFIQKFIPNV